MSQRLTSHNCVRLVRFIAEQCLVRGEQAAILGNDGAPQEWLLDLRPALLDPHLLAEIVTGFWAAVGPGPWQVGGMETAAIPLVTAILIEGRSRGLDVSGFIVRKQRKQTGLGRRVEGRLNGNPVILVDDVVHSGRSLEKARVVLAAEGVTIRHAFAVVDYRAPASALWSAVNGIAIMSLLTLEDLGLRTQRGGPAPPARRYEPLWQFRPGGGNPFFLVPKSAPLLLPATLVCGSDSGTIYALEPETGREQWRFHAQGAGRKGVWSSPAHHGGRLYFGAYNGDVYCLSAADGGLLWRSPLCEWVGSSPLVIPQLGLVYIGLEYQRPGAAGSFAALDMETGEKIWEAWLRSYQHGSACYFVDGGLVIYGTNDCSILARDARTGRRAWRFRTRQPVRAAPVVDEKRGLAIAACADRSIYVVDAQTGALRAEFRTGNVCYTTPLIVGGRLFCGSGDRMLYVVDLDSLTIVGRVDCGARVYAAPRLIEGKVVFGCNSGLVREINPVTLEVEGEVQLPDAVTNAVAADPSGSRLFVPTYVNEVHAFERSG